MFNSLWVVDPNVQSLIKEKWRNINNIEGASAYAQLVEIIKSIKGDVVRWNLEKLKSIEA